MYRTDPPPCSTLVTTVTRRSWRPCSPTLTSKSTQRQRMCEYLHFFTSSSSKFAYCSSASPLCWWRRTMVTRTWSDSSFNILKSTCSRSARFALLWCDYRMFDYHMIQNGKSARDIAKEKHFSTILKLVDEAVRKQRWMMNVFNSKRKLTSYRLSKYEILKSMTESSIIIYMRHQWIS